MTATLSNSSWTIRRATASDYDAIRTVWQACGSSIRPTGRDSREAFELQLARFPDLYLAAEECGQVVGVVLGSHDFRKGWINRLAVLPSHRHRGIARALVSACDAAIRAHGIHIVAALIEPPNDASCATFESLGYTVYEPIRYYRKASGPEL